MWAMANGIKHPWKNNPNVIFFKKINEEVL
jgi:hypothetical protein